MCDDEAREFTIEVTATADAYRGISQDPRAFGVLMRTVLVGNKGGGSWDDARKELAEHYGVKITSTRTVFR